MSVLSLLLTIALLAAAGFLIGKQKALSSAGGDARKLHSLSGYYGWNVALWVLIPSLALLAAWLIAQPALINMSVAGQITTVAEGDSAGLSLVMSDIRRVADGIADAKAAGLVNHAELVAADVDLAAVQDTLKQVGVVMASDLTGETLGAALSVEEKSATGNLAMTVLVIAAGVIGGALAYLKTSKDLWARNRVEQVVRVALIAAASIAILTTIGIVMSLIFNTVKFFQIYPAADFFFGTNWAPKFQGHSDLGILPLLWGTFYISLLALLVAVPVGLFAAIYLSEYAPRAVRSIAKPMLEVLAGIPTIVYGLFALLTVGPMLKSVFGQGGWLGVAWMSADSSVMTAGLVMGIMLIPFVSSLSDDIINAVPQSMRDGSLGLGATSSETIRQVVLPAALPGIVGAVLMAASRAIGETMIVVLGAGVAAQMSLNPFDAMTTVTTRIVAQLTGDNDFSSPTALVAFALGMSLFVMTLCLNVLALYVVRKYREQYD